MLRSVRIDARHFSTAEIDAGLPPGADPEGVAIVFLVSAYPSPERERADSISLQLHALLPQANLIRVFCPGIAAPPESGNSGDHPECLRRAVDAIGLAQIRDRQKQPEPDGRHGALQVVHMRRHRESACKGRDAEMRARLQEPRAEPRRDNLGQE